MAVQGVFGEEMWIVNADYPGGTAQYFADHSSVWYETLDTAVVVVTNLGTDGYQVRLVSYRVASPALQSSPSFLQIYRLWVVWNRDIRVILFLCLLYLASAGQFVSLFPVHAQDAVR